MLKVWIELDRPTSDEHAQRLVDAANAMMARLGCKEKVFGRFDGHFVHYLPGNSGYLVLEDRGEWFNLEYLANSPADEA